MAVAQKFREFRGNSLMLSIAFGIVLSGVLGRLVASLAGDLLYPPLAALMGGADFSHIGSVLADASPGREAILWRYGVLHDGH